MNRLNFSGYKSGTPSDDRQNRFSEIWIASSPEFCDPLGCAGKCLDPSMSLMKHFAEYVLPACPILECFGNMIRLNGHQGQVGTVLNTAGALDAPPKAHQVVLDDLRGHLVGEALWLKQLDCRNLEAMTDSEEPPATASVLQGLLQHVWNFTCPNESMGTSIPNANFPACRFNTSGRIWKNHPAFTVSIPRCLV